MTATEQKIIDHFNSVVTDGKCSCGARRDSRCQPFTSDNILRFKQHIIKQVDGKVSI